MRLSLPALVLLAPGLLQAAEIPVTTNPEKKRNLPTISLLPVGSVLSRVMLPRYDAGRNLSGMLKAEEMTLITEDEIEGKSVSFEFFNPDRSAKGRLDLVQAVFDQKKGLIKADKPVSIVSDRISAEGTGLVYAFDQGKGILIGPGTTRIINPPATAMNTSSPALRATAILSASFLPLAAAPQPFSLPPEQAAQIKSDAVSRAEKATEAAASTRNDLRTALEASAAANQATMDFLVQADLPPKESDTDHLPATKPHEIPADPDMTVINFKGGMYLDPEALVSVFLKDVSVKDARFNLDGANELKIFFDQKQPKKSSEAPKVEKPKEPKGEEAPQTLKADKNNLNFGGGNLGNPRRIVATGAVHILQKATDGKDPVEASGAIFTYDLLTKDIVITGGYPWVISKTTGYARSRNANGVLRVNPNGEVSLEGEWDLGKKLDQKDR